jgi:cell wall assembly regulator SMI1
MKAEAPVAAKEPAKPNGKSTQAKPGIEAKIAKIEALAKKAGVTLSGGATEEAIAKLEKALGVKLPAEVRAFYLAHDGGPPNTGVFSGRALLSLKGILTYWKVWKKAFDDGEMDEDTEPDEGIQQEWWVPQWIPVTSDFGGNHDMIDLAPDEGGKVGQIIAVWHDDTSRTIEGDSFLDWLAEQTWGEGE